MFMPRRHALELQLILRCARYIKVSVSMPQSKPQWNEYLVETGQFDWAKLKQDNKDLTDKIL